MAVHLKSRITGSEQTFIRQNLMYSEMTCQLKIVDTKSNVVYDIRSPNRYYGEPTYLTFHLLDTIAMNVELAFAITTTKDIGKEFDVTYISYMGLLLIHL